MPLILFLLVLHAFGYTRSPHREKEQNIPEIRVKYSNQSNSEAEILQSYLLREAPIFKTFNEESFFKHLMLTSVTIDSQKIYKADIDKLIDGLLEEINSNKKKFTNFKKLKMGYNKFKKNGFAIVKFNDFPLVLKLFIETPYGITHPYEKGFEERGIFTMGGGNRYFLGFSRIKNKDKVRKILDSKEKWKNITMPNKWTWLPNNTPWLQIDGYNIGGKKHQQIKTPAIYAIICEEVKPDGTKISKASRQYLELCTELNYLIDPRSINFKVKNNNLSMMDTEHFPTLIGTKRKLNASHTYSSWYVKIGGIYLKAGYLTSKKERQNLQNVSNLYEL